MYDSDNNHGLNEEFSKVCENSSVPILLKLIMVSDSQEEHRGRFPSRTDQEDEDETQPHERVENEQEEQEEEEQEEAEGEAGAETGKAPGDEVVAEDHILRPSYNSTQEQNKTIGRTKQRGGVGVIGAGGGAGRPEGERITSQSLPSSTTHTPRRKGQHLTGARKDSASQTNHERSSLSAAHHPRGRGGAMGGADSGGEWPFGPEDDFVHGYSEDEGDENHLDMRMSRFSQPGHPHGHGRSRSMMRYNEIERERSKRRQHILKQKTGSKFFPGTFKLSLMNSGVIPLKKGRLETKKSTLSSLTL